MTGSARVSMSTSWRTASNSKSIPSEPLSVQHLSLSRKRGSGAIPHENAKPLRPNPTQLDAAVLQ